MLRGTSGFRMMVAAALLSAGCASGRRSQWMVWEKTPIPQEPAGGLAGGAPARVDEGTLVLRGQPVRSQGVYAAPLTIECDVRLEGPADADANWEIRLVAADHGAKTSPGPTVAVALQYHGSSGPRSALNVYRSTGSSPAQKVGKERAIDFRPGTTCHVDLQVLADHLEVRMGGQRLDVPGIGVPAGKFRIELQGAPSAARWQIRNFVVR